MKGLTPNLADPKSCSLSCKMKGPTPNLVMHVASADVVRFRDSIENYRTLESESSPMGKDQIIAVKKSIELPDKAFCTSGSTI